MNVASCIPISVTSILLYTSFNIKSGLGVSGRNNKFPLRLDALEHYY